MVGLVPCLLRQVVHAGHIINMLNGILERLIPNLNRCVEIAVINANGVKELPSNQTHLGEDFVLNVSPFQRHASQ